MPPAVDTLYFSPGPGNGRTYTSYRPDSSETYASHRPSGENAGAVSLNGDGAKACGSLAGGIPQIWPWSANARTPRGDNARGTDGEYLLRVADTASSAPLPF